MNLLKERIKKSNIYPLAKYFKDINIESRKQNVKLFEILKQRPLIYSCRDDKKSVYIRKALAFKKLLNRMKISIDDNSLFVGRRTIYSFPIYQGSNERFLNVGNLTPDYNTVLKKGFSGIKEEALDLKRNNNINADQKDFLESVILVCESAIELTFRYAEKLLSLSKKAGSGNRERLKRLSQICKQVPAQPANSFHEALQSVFFTNMLLWTEGHHLIGLGRIDQYLWPYYKKDKESGSLSADDAYTLIKHFWKGLNEDYKKKSHVLLGDTGQSAVLGGLNQKNGQDATNELTYLFLSVAKDLKLVDPKIILRVHSNTSDQLWYDSIELLKTGVGYPLYASDEIIIPSLVKFGYEEKDALDYGVSACWEPTVPGKSFDMNNIGVINFIKLLEASLNNGKSLLTNENIGLSSGTFSECANFDELMENICKQMSDSIKRTVENVKRAKFEPSPFLSAITRDCLNKGLDISVGGAKYNNFGLLSGGFVNMVNAIISIRKLVFEDKRIEKNQLLEILRNDFKDSEQLRLYIVNRIPKFGNDIDEVDDLALELANYYGAECLKYKNQFGGHYKAGLGGAGSYIMETGNIAASADGRKCGDPFASNFSPSPGTDMAGLTAVGNSVGKIDFEKVFNGSVLDLKLSPSLFKGKENITGLIGYLKVLLKKCEEVQFNVINTELLKKAFESPELYRDLIVRVWGFSAYFVDLPREYQKHLIERHEHNI